MGVTTVEYNVRQSHLVELLESVDRPGDYCFCGKTTAYMPRLVVEAVGTISFPLPVAQVESLIRAAEQSPYGRGLQTLVDTSVRNSWQIDASRVRLEGSAWDSTLAGMVSSVAEGIGCPGDRLSAQLYKLLVYEEGGFFAEHRDSEKAEGMVATLVVSLPAEGEGGEIVIRHNGRETVFDMCVSYPDELAYAAFYADCLHETRRVRSGHRVSLVYNLILSGDRSAESALAPVYAEEVRQIAALLTGWSRQGGDNEKIVWLLDHCYSEAGLSFDALKGVDAAVAGVLSEAAALAQCDLLAAILHVREVGSAVYSQYGGGYYDDSYIDVDGIEHPEANGSWLDSWKSEDGNSPAFGEVPLLPEELLPLGALDDADPDDAEVEEAMGNAAPSIEHAYRSAALVIWPRAKTLDILLSGGMEGALEYALTQAGEAGPGLSDDRMLGLVARLFNAWPRENYRSDAAARAKMLRLLAARGARAEPYLSRFLHTIVLPRYSGTENEELVSAARKFGPEVLGRFLPELFRTHLWAYPQSVTDLASRLYRRVASDWEESWATALDLAVLAMTEAIPEALRRAGQSGRGSGRSRSKRQDFGSTSVSAVLRLGWQSGLDRETKAAARQFAEHPDVVPPGRAIPEALAALPDFAGESAFATLWRHAADSLLSRSANRPKSPTDWYVAENLKCNCQACRRLKWFCRDPVSRTGVFPMRQELRRHLRDKIRKHRLPIDTRTQKKGNPYRIICTKNRSDHKGRLAEYEADILSMKLLIRTPPEDAAGGGTNRRIARLQAACARSG